MACCGRSAPLVRRGHRRLGGRLTTVRRASRTSGSSGASARGAGSHGSVSSGIKSPPVRVLALASRALGAERIEDPPRGLRPRMLPLTPCPANSSEAQNTRAFALRRPGSPPRAASVCYSWRHASWCARPYNPHVFQSGAVRRPVPLDGLIDQTAITASL